MNRRTRIFALSVVASLAVAGYVRASAQHYQEQLKALSKTAAQKRAALGLDKDRVRLYREFTTPEVHFGATPGVCPGQTATVTLTGKFAPETSFLYDSDDVEVAGEKITATRYDAQVTAKPGALPQRVVLHVLTPVSLAERELDVLDIGCTYEWKLDVADGQTLTVRTQNHKGPIALTVEGEWSKGGKPLGKTPVRVSGSASDGFEFEREASAAEQQGAAMGMMAAMQSPEYQALDKRTQAVMAEMNKCQKVPPAQMGACMKGPSDELNAISKDREALLKKAQSGGAPAGTFKGGCQTIRVRANGTALTGEADSCGDAKSLKVTGTVKAI